MAADELRTYRLFPKTGALDDAVIIATGEALLVAHNCPGSREAAYLAAERSWSSLAQLRSREFPLELEESVKAKRDEHPVYAPPTLWLHRDALYTPTNDAERQRLDALLDEHQLVCFRLLAGTNAEWPLAAVHGSMRWTLGQLGLVEFAGEPGFVNVDEHAASLYALGVREGYCAKKGKLKSSAPVIDQLIDYLRIVSRPFRTTEKKRK
ncbi:hypothetical protein HY493_04540 [Candidatus Woesearchaeota archaeon]|nr:hypothetical protein [Candidatus Woesearchaeota archaeon]